MTDEQFTTTTDDARRLIRLRQPVDIAALKQQADLSQFPQRTLAIARLLVLAGEFDQTIDLCRGAIARNINDLDIYSPLTQALYAVGRYDESLAYHAQALVRSPVNPEIIGSRALLRLKMGDLAGGFADYEYRWQVKDFPNKLPEYKQSRWTGSNPAELAGKTILVHCEQGLGDTLMFIRYVSLLAKRGARVIVGCQHPVRWLVEQVPGVTVAITSGSPLPRFDLHIPLLSLPHALGTTLQTIPADVPYLKVDAARLHRWEKRLAELEQPKHGGADRGRPFRIGLAWAGRPTHVGDYLRSMPLANLAPLAAIDGVVFYSLQKGDASAKTPPAGMPLHDFSAQLYDFGDTAALVSQLDLVISVDTAVAHLAGALAKPVWTLLPHSSEWRWLIDRDDSPWYPTMRLFYQVRRGDWSDVVARVAAELRHLARSVPVAL